jgi:hypothetical protein
MNVLTRRDTVFDHVNNRCVETPVTLPISHCFTTLEVFGKMIDTDGPGVHDDATETASGTNFRGGHLPLLHGPAGELDTVHELQVLTQVVLPVECSFSKCPLLARRMVVTLDVGFVGIRLATKDTRNLPVLGAKGTRAIRRAYPALERQVQ